MCPEEADIDDGAGISQSAFTSGDGPEVCWGQGTLRPKRDVRAILNGRSVAALAALAVAAVVAGIAVATLGGNSGSGTTEPTPLAQVAYVTTQAPGFKFELTVTGSVGGQSFTFGGAGSMDERDLEGTMSLQIAGETLREIIKNPYIYVSVPSDASTAIAGGKAWVRANINTFGEALGASTPVGANTTEPTQMLSLLKAGGQVTTLGEQSVRGVATTHYHALVDFSRLVSVAAPNRRAATERYADELKRITGSSSLPIDVWVDARQRVRRFSTQLQICTPQGSLVESITMNLYDYGRQPTVIAPAPSEVTDVTSELSSRTSQVLAQLSC